MNPEPPSDLAAAEAAPAEVFPSEKYEMGGLVARGGMGAVWQARQLAARRTVAMKVLLDGADDDERQRLRFIEEAQITSQLEHPNIVPIHDVGVNATGGIYYTMKLVKGITLQQIIEQLKKGDRQAAAKYSLSALLTIFQKVCDAVAFAHARGVIHRDLKPANLMVGEFGEVLVMDWGLAKLLGTPAAPAPPALEPVASARADEGAAHATVDGCVLGTPAYMAPEQARGELDRLDQRTDIFALGIILYELLALRRPFVGKTAAATMERLLSGEAPRSPAERAGEERAQLLHLPRGRVPGSLSAVALRALAFAPGDRYQSMAEFQRDLTAYQNGFATSAEERTARKLLRLFLRRHRAVSAAIAGALVLLAALSIAFTVRVTGERNRAAQALADLRKTAPTFAAQAQSLVEQQQFGPAIEKLDFAITIDPASPVYRLRRADLLQASLRLQEAADEYRRVLDLGPNEHAQTNLALTEKILDEAGGEDPPDPQLLHPLYQAMRQQKRELEAVPLGARLGLGAESALPAIQAALAEYIKMPQWRIVPSWMMNYRSRINREPDGTFALYLAQIPMQDLTALTRLRGLPISILDINGSLVSDLSPIAGLPLRELSAASAPIADLEPLRGMKLRKLVLRRANIVSLEPLRGMPLEELSLSQCGNLDSFEVLAGLPLRRLGLAQTKIGDWSPLAGLPLKELSATGCAVEDLRPLQAMPLEELNLQECGKLVSLEGLQGRPLRSLNLARTKVRDLSPLRGLPLRELTLNDIPASDLSPLHGMPLEVLSAAGHTGIVTLAGLEGLPLRQLQMNHSSVRDIEALRGAPLEKVVFTASDKIKDLSVLGSCPRLKHIACWVKAPGIEVLRSRPKLRFDIGGVTTPRPVSAAQFWAEHDAKVKKP